MLISPKDIIVHLEILMCDMIPDGAKFLGVRVYGILESCILFVKVLTEPEKST